MTEFFPSEENGRELEIFTNAPNGTLAHYVYYELGKDHPCFLLKNKQWLELHKEAFTRHRFVIAPGKFLEKIAYLCRLIYQRDLFYNTKSILEVLRAFYVSKRLPRSVNEFLDRWYASVLV